MLAEDRFDRAHDSVSASDREPLPYLEWLLAREMPGCDNLLATPKLIPIIDAAHQTRANDTQPADALCSGACLVIGNGSPRRRCRDLLFARARLLRKGLRC